MAAALSISSSASTNGSPSRAASLRPMDVLPHPISPTRTRERPPNASRTRASVSASAAVLWLRSGPERLILQLAAGQATARAGKKLKTNQLTPLGQRQRSIQPLTVQSLDPSALRVIIAPIEGHT